MGLFPKTTESNNQSEGDIVLLGTSNQNSFQNRRRSYEIPALSRMEVQALRSKSR